MKNAWYDTIAVVLIVVTIFSGVTIARVVQNKYIRQGVVVSTNAATEENVVVDTAGNQWMFYGVGYVEGDSVTMTMDANSTDNIITDDIIKDVTINTKQVLTRYIMYDIMYV